MALFSNTTTLYSGGLLLAWYIYGKIKERRENPAGLPLPPGPKGYPIIDSLFDIPTNKPWLVYNEWTKKYGDMFYFKALGQPFIVISSVDAAYELFERRSSNYSDRARMTMLNELMDWTWNFAFQQYGNRWRRHRRTFHDYFHPNVVDRYNDIQTEASRAFLRRLLASPDDFMLHIRHAFTTTIMKIAYGITITDEDESGYAKTAEIALASLAAVGNPGSFLVDLFPLMKHIPEWLPGAGFQKKASYWRYISNLFANGPWNEVKGQLKEGTAQPSMATTLLEKLPDENSPERADEEVTARNACAVSFAGGADTTVSTIQGFFMAMALYPEVQRKAQEELDRVLNGRFPEFNDRPSLPYINAMVKESMRWQLVTPLAVPHKATEADEYNGYYIPKGTLVIGNAWAMLHDPEVYKDPMVYNPERFLKNGEIDKSVRDPAIASFGFGRRICPGRFLADNSLFILISHILSVYNISPALDKNDKEIKIIPEMTSGLLSYPEPFKCRIIARTKKAEEMIRDSELMA
ncbi:O-methylsterigmatocystin oxidoreductase [Leucoagaricus sp. SymC.cos]|nr:O-methylsterigmatocystin oxidoreductase [Leucoagaricus sp. SymC.cos]